MKRLISAGLMFGNLIEVSSPQLVDRYNRALKHLTGKQTARPHQTLYWRYGPQWAIRHGDLKLVVSKGGSGQPELYDLSTDIGESKDLASAQPAKVKELQALWDKWSAEQANPTTPDSPTKAKKGGKKKK